MSEAPFEEFEPGMDPAPVVPVEESPVEGLIP